MNAMEEKKCSPASGSHRHPVPMQQPYPLDLSANSFGPSHHQQQQQQPRPFMHHRHLPPNFAAAPDAARRPGIPPLSPYSQMPPRSPPSSSSSSCSPFHSRSLSQPAFFSLDSLPPLSPPPPAPHALPPPAPTSMHLPPSEVAAAAAAADDSLLQQISRTPAGRSSPEGGGSGSGGRLPPRKAHRRSQSDIPFAVASATAAGFLFQPPPMSPGTMAGPALLPPQQPRQQQLVKQESSDWEKEAESGDHRSDGGDVGDDLISAYMNLDNLETLNSCETEERREYMDGSRHSGTRTNNGPDSSENEAESSSVNASSGGGERKEGNKRSAAGDLTPINSRHSRSLSMDSLMSKLNFGDESPRLPPSPGNPTGQLSRSGSMDGATANILNLEFGNGEFNSAELKKIMANEKLAEMALTDPKRVKRILANRQSAARSKERKMRYISELEHKVQTLQTEATTLSAQLTLLQRDSAGLTSQNNELKFRIQSMEQQAQLRDALNQALTAEVHRLKLATGEITEAQLSKNINQQMHMNAQVFQLRQLQSQQQQSPQVPCYQLQTPENQQQQQQNNAPSESEEKKC